LRKRPLAWTPPGPSAPGEEDPSLSPGADETLDCLCGHWKIFQLRRGHRYSTDDLLTAWFAADAVSKEGRVPATQLDLGCGIGSIGMLLLWRFPELRLVGIEAQRHSVDLARRSARYNGVADRAEIRWGDFRAPCLLADLERFDIVTASPPYLVAGEGRRSDRPQRGPCRFEDRGGVDAYLEKAAAHLAPGGLVAWVHATRYTDANLRAARAAGFSSAALRPVVFREGREGVITLFRATLEGDRKEQALAPLVVRRSDGSWSADYEAVRRAMGYPV
jgi:tRNA1(Val) A37 N6-methylase TrmN6